MPARWDGGSPVTMFESGGSGVLGGRLFGNGGHGGNGFILSGGVGGNRGTPFGSTGAEGSSGP